ncbi:phosphate ABC transporter permease subunit PstC [Flavobacterium gawalongense]|uniref:Phosphate transport system permease protein n=1 Tax=Flavobacterium gawalongense TaxID=2594432 RepID=A0A553BLS2_9FLAO|nr:phosphate ABC transporter permease subunit PstC [Flavobacterium gawalongense]TRX01219.1 phosphate ABC transporter permease subunit PstC [Flavobacterium gawalongense]TRX05256.1 phosphate ABC transporter permease subunit PstC [Flavobacterium gawalongense]TRX09159.1 phosphate ABC transporter permease subunit PstC [Flavobacterium gawalongense]TRX09206.1 phosphate ABC transporter permease subunit PstC [Flavobacterium gawalongense]TRX26663.1 phosphate ABC transporter permease subunit PstC [Flavob
MNSPLPSKQIFTKESLKKQFRLSEFLAEKVISFVAFLSIAIIFLIFIFVFKESMPLFSFGKKDKVKTEIQTTSDVKVESYEGAETSTEEIQPETYGAPTEDLNPVTQETQTSEELEPDTYGAPTEDLNPETATGKEVIIDEKATENKEGADRTWSTFFSTEWVPVSDNPRFGLLALLVGTLKVTIIAILIAGPLAILAAVYTSCFASNRRKEIIKPIIEMLAAFPSVVIGFFAMMVLATFFQDIFGYDSRLNAFIGGVAMALAAIPIIYTISEDALSAVPKTFTEASLALGASKAQTAFFVILPAATPGIFAAILLGIGRVFGETMIALMATGNAALLSANPFESVRTFAATIGSEMAETVFGETHYSVLFFIGSLLFIFSFILNAVAEFYVKGKLIKKFQGK